MAQLSLFSLSVLHVLAREPERQWSCADVGSSLRPLRFGPEVGSAMRSLLRRGLVERGFATRVETYRITTAGIAVARAEQMTINTDVDHRPPR